MKIHLKIQARSDYNIHNFFFLNKNIAHSQAPL